MGHYSFIDQIGNTPIVQLKNILDKDSAKIFVKLEGTNPGGSHKTRVALNMINEAEKDGVLFPNSGQTIVEGTSGNTGMGLALVACLKGYKVKLVIPKHYINEEKANVLKAYGADVVVCESSFGAHIRTAQRLCDENQDFVYLNQFINPSNPKAHYLFTAKEILRQVPGKIDAFVCGVGTGGTLSGVGKRLKEVNEKTIVVAMQPEGCDVLKGIVVPHEIKGNVSTEGVPQTLDVKIVDRTISVSIDEIKRIAKLLTTREGLCLGISSCANIVAAMKLGKYLGKNKSIITISHDFGSNYIRFYHDLVS